MAMTTATRKGARLVPEDLCPAAVKLARRLQALKNNRFYAIMLVKSGGEYHYVIEERGQTERAG
jgi:hypothetical protein